MRDERRKVREPEGSERRDSKRSSSVRDLNLVRLARNGDLDSMKQMIKDGADVNEQDECGWTALHEACMRNLPRMTEYLLRHGADPGMVNAKGDTALHCAARIGCLRIVRALLYYNANPLLLNHKGDKPLDLCQDAEVSNFLNQHIETNQIHMVSSSGSGKPAVLKVTRQHSTTSRSGKHLTSTSGTTVSDAIEYHGGGKDNNSMTSVSDVYSDSDGNDDNGDDDCHSTSTLSMSTSLAHQNIISPASNNQSDMNNLSSSGQHSHQTSSPSLSSVPKCIPDMYISSTKSSVKKDPYAFEDDESDGTVNNPGNSLLLHPSPTNNTLTGHTGIHSSCGGGGGVGTASLTKTNTSPSSGLLSKHTHQLSSSNLPIVESVNIISDSNQSHSTTGHIGSGSSNNNSIGLGGPPLRLRFAKEAGQYTLMEQQQQLQADLSLTNSDTNPVPSSGITCSATETPHVTVVGDNANVNNNYNNDNNQNTVCYVESTNDGCNVGNEHDRSLDMLVTTKSEHWTGEEAEHISASCHSESSSGEDSLSQKVPPLRIKFASGTSGDNESSMVSSSVSVGIPSGYTIHSNNSSNCIINNSKVENNGVDEVEGKEKLEMKPRVSVDSVNRNDGKEVPVTVPAATTDTVSLSTPEKDKAPVTDLLSGFATEDNDDKCSTHHPKIHKSHGHSTATNLNSASEYDGESSTEISTSIPVSTPSATSTTGTINTTGSGGGVSSTGNFGRVKTESSLETTNTSHPGSGNSNRSNSSNAGSGNKETAKDTHRHRSGRTLRSHTAAQREKEEKERHTDDNTPIKKRKLRSRSDASSHDSNTNSHSRSGGGGVSGTGNANSSPVTTHSGSTPPSNVLSSTNAVVNMEVSEDTLILPVVTASQIDTSLVDEEKRPVVISQAMMSDEENDVHMPCVSEGEQKSSISSTNMEVDVKIEGCGLPTSVSTLSMELPASMDVVPPTVSVASSSTTAVSVEKLGRRGEAELDVDYLLCPAGPGDEDRKNIELLKFQNPYAKAAELNKSLRELVNNLVKVHPKAPCGYQDYLLVTRNYLLANQPSLATYVKRVPPPNLEPAFVELFNEQEEERYAQALKHQSEREHLQLGAEQAVLRAQTRGALAVANQAKPYSFCSILSYNDLTYIPPVGKVDNREEESIRDRFTPRTFIGWLQDIIDTFQNEKKKQLCRQLHEAESLMMVQKMDWEMKARETLANVDCIGVDIFKDIPASCVPLIPVPNDFPLFAHDPVHRTTSMTVSTTSTGNPTGSTSNNGVDTNTPNTTTPTATTPPNCVTTNTNNSQTEQH